MSDMDREVGQPGSTQSDGQLADWAAEIGDRVVAGEPVDLATLASGSSRRALTSYGR